MGFPRDNVAWRPMFGSYPTTPQQQQPQQQTPQFMPSFQSSLLSMAGYGNVVQGAQPTQVMQQPQTQMPVQGYDWNPQGVAPGTGPLAQVPAAQAMPAIGATPAVGTGASTPPSNVGAYAGMALQGVNMAANLGMGIASLVQSQEAFNKQMGMANKNYAAQVQAYNNALEDKIRGRYSVQSYNSNKKAIEAEIDRKKQKKDL